MPRIYLNLKYVLREFIFIQARVLGDNLGVQTKLCRLGCNIKSVYQYNKIFQIRKAIVVVTHPLSELAH